MPDQVHSPTTAGFIAYHARLGATVAVQFESGEVSYSQLDADIALACRYLRHENLRHGDLIVIGLGNAYAHLVFVLAADVLGVMSCSVQMSEEVLPFDVMASAKLVLTEQGAPPGAGTHHSLPPDWRALAKDYAQAPVAGLSDSDPVRLVRSSGTTGTPKKIIIRRGRQHRWLAYLAFSAGYGPQTRFYVAASFPVNAFYMRAVLCLRMGGCLLMGGLSMLSRATHTWMLPTTLELVMEELPAGFVKPERLEISTAGAALPSATRLRVCGSLASSIVNSYGSNEVGPVCIMAEDGRGVVVPGTEVQIVDDQDRELPVGQPGQLRARNAIMAEGYHDHPVATAERFKQGWFYPGDEALMLAPGELRLIGRIDDMLNFAGFKRRPEEVEELLKTVPGVRDVAALTQHNHVGVVTLYLGLVLESGAVLDDVIPALRALLKLPVKELVMRQFGALPRTSTGKLRRKALLPFFAENPKARA